MTIGIKKKGELFLFEKATDRLNTLDGNLGAVYNEVIGYLTGYYENKANHWWNRLTGKEFNEERTEEYWRSLPYDEVLNELFSLRNNYGETKANDYQLELQLINNRINVVRFFIRQVANAAVEEIFLTEKDYNIIFPR